MALASCLFRGAALARKPLVSQCRQISAVPFEELWSPEEPIVTQVYSKGGPQAWITKLWTQERLGLMELDPSVFCIRPRLDIIHEVCRWKIACDRHGAESSMRRCDLGFSGKKLGKNTGMGRARHSNRAAPQFQQAKNTDAWGLKPFDRSFNVNLKVRRLAMRSALSIRYAQDNLFIVDDMDVPDVSLEKLKEMMLSFGWSKVLFVRQEPHWHSYLNQSYPDLYKKDWDAFMAAVNTAEDEKIKCVTLNEMSTYEVMEHSTLVMTASCARTLEEQLHWV